MGNSIKCLSQEDSNAPTSLGVKLRFCNLSITSPVLYQLSHATARKEINLVTVRWQKTEK